MVVAGGIGSALVDACSGALEQDSNISLLLCEESIPGSPAPEPEPDAQAPFASAARAQTTSKYTYCTIVWPLRECVFDIRNHIDI